MASEQIKELLLKKMDDVSSDYTKEISDSFPKKEEEE